MNTVTLRFAFCLKKLHTTTSYANARANIGPQIRRFAPLTSVSLQLETSLSARIEQ